MVNPMLEILCRSNDVFDAVSSVCPFCERGLDKTCPQKALAAQAGQGPKSQALYRMVDTER